MERKRGTPGDRDESREKRLKAALRSNLAKRKAQARARRPDKDDAAHGQPDDTGNAQDMKDS